MTKVIPNFNFTNGSTKDEEIVQGTTPAGEIVSVRRLYRGLKGNRVRYNYEILIEGRRQSVDNMRNAQDIIDELLSGEPAENLEPREENRTPQEEVKQEIKETSTESAKEITPEITYSVKDLAKALGKSPQVIRIFLRKNSIQKTGIVNTLPVYSWNKTEFIGILKLLKAQTQDDN